MATSEHEPLIGGGSGLESREDGYDSRYAAARRQTQTFLSSKAGHYTVIAMVAADVGGIFASFIIDQYLCDHECCQYMTRYRNLHDAQDALEYLSLIFSCLFMVELLCSVWAFGLPQVSTALALDYA